MLPWDTHLLGLQLSLACCCWALGCQEMKSSPDFSLPGDYLIAGLFALHTGYPGVRRKPEVTLCDRPNSFSGHGYHLFQAMRFAIEQINNSTSLLPNITLGYELYDVCSDSANVYAVLSILSPPGTRLIEIQRNLSSYSPKVVAVIGPDTTNRAGTAAAMLSPFLVPLISYSASSAMLSSKRWYPSFLRTIPSDKNQVKTIVLLLQRFGWVWISLVGSDGDYGHLGVQALEGQATRKGICIAFKGVVPFSARAGDERMQDLILDLARLLQQIRNDTLTFDDSGDSLSGYDIITWDWSGPKWTFRVIGSSRWPPVRLDINKTKIQWHRKNNQVPKSVCNQDCSEGYRRMVTGVHHCCFMCVSCEAGTFLNKSDLYRCQPCGKEEWAPERSQTCFPRTVVFLTWHTPISWVLLATNTLLLLLLVGTAGLFGLHLDTPVVKSAGGRLCFLMLGSLAVGSCSLYCFFGEPTLPTCLLRLAPFALGFTVFLSCLTIRSFQLVFIFKFSAKVPTFYRAWVQNHGAGLFVVFSSIAQLLICLMWLAVWTPLPTREYQRFSQLVVLECTQANSQGFMLSFAYNGLLSLSAFVCSYLGKDLPENYNEAKCVTFSLLLNFVSWITFFTMASVYQGKYLPAINMLAVLSSLYGGFSGYFLPKCYVILCRPDLNSTEYFQASIQDYTRRWGST
ncbi:taste receptor type 1 member 1 isoform X3 [Loxodonta africana]|uniref:taste receptor type 1 member 1 isoform X3 n=1 Tax=Loxodonta africana TaxID=9785 RepID=UPI0030D49F85